MFWLLLGALVVLSLVLLGLTLLSLWRRVKVLGRSVAEVGAAAGQASTALSALAPPVRAGEPCPTCGVRSPAVTGAPAAVRRQARRATPSGVG